MRTTIRSWFFLTALMALSLYIIFPVDESLRLGKDLAGGVSLVYTVDVKPDDPSDVVDRTIEVLKDRVNPQGLYEISFQKQGRDRIEITMPLPNDKVKALRDAYDAELTKLGAYAIDVDAFERAMRQRGADRDAALTALMDTPGRKQLLQPVLEAARKADSTRAAYEEGRTALQDAAQVDRLLSDAGEADAALEQAREKVLGAAFTPEEVRAALELPADKHTVRNQATGEVVSIPSAYDRAVEGLRNRLKGLDGADAAMDAVFAAHQAYKDKQRGFDDPNDLVRMLQGAGVLTFRIAVMPGTMPEEAQIRREFKERGRTSTSGVGWYKINKLDSWYESVESLKALRDAPTSYFADRYRLVVEERDGAYWALLRDVPGQRLTKAEGRWALTMAFQTHDELGKPAIGFQLDPPGGALMGRLTEENVRKPMAVLLDDQVYTAPNINSRISTNGIIQGTFSAAELNYVIKTLSAGSLSAKLGERPISQSVLAPELGLDNLKQGLKASWIALVVIGVFMVGYYFLSGFVAMIALACNAILILATMALAHAAFTLPGIAGVVLTFGTAVDANVLIYERVREELAAGHDLKSAIRIAFKRANATIVDANMTNLIICLVLVFVGTQETKGFGITLGIGVVMTMFTALIVTRMILILMVDKLHVRKLSQLPIAVPAVQRALIWNVDWMGKFPLFVAISVILTGVGLAAVVFRGDKMLDSEFRGGTAVTIKLREESPGTRLNLTRAQVEERVRKVGKAAETSGDAVLKPLIEAEVVPVDPRPDGITSDKFIIRSEITDDAKMRQAVVSALGDVVESTPALKFVGSEYPTLDAGPAPVHQIVQAELGPNIGRPDVVNNVSRFIGGVAIVFQNIEPAQSKETLALRLEYARGNPLYSSSALKRNHELIVLDGDDRQVRTAVLVVADPVLNVFEDETRWRTDLASQEWRMAHDELTTPTILASVNTFSSAVAQTFRAQAIAAIILSLLLILIYVWVRFGSARYAVASILPLIHDVLVAIGAIAFAEYLYEWYPAVSNIGIRPFKIDMGMVAALLAIIGYSINDTIIILDRVRENRGKLLHVSKDMINHAINQTMSRTLITSGTAITSLVILFIFGGEGIASFSYAMLVGMLIGTYSSIAVAAPIVYDRRIPPAGPFPGGAHGADAAERARATSPGLDLAPARRTSNA